MSFETDIFERIKDMDEMEAKKMLAIVVSKFMKVGKNGYTKEDCYNDVHEVYREIVISDLFKKEMD
ncbi:hypothetical protein [Schinkia azotoformans]|uniref:hypothetical protein n=1 Tax=Schinkia azotoformans TaxID=1454 RepID=UPI002DBF2886|nr:hypothetical protein [Schinkia azotoformans]MEC1778417.1 hypothetical protein [Schinkia azotoformans]MED4328338.1 hypothetical protein [Schinkia azotoformans]